MLIAFNNGCETQYEKYMLFKLCSTEEMTNLCLFKGMQENHAVSAEIQD